METIGFNNCREMSENNRDTNGMLAVMQERTRFFCKDEQNFINVFAQSINGLCWVSQLHPRIKEQKELSDMI